MGYIKEKSYFQIKSMLKAALLIHNSAMSTHDLSVGKYFKLHPIQTHQMTVVSQMSIAYSISFPEVQNASFQMATFLSSIKNFIFLPFLQLAMGMNLNFKQRFNV